MALVIAMVDDDGDGVGDDGSRSGVAGDAWCLGGEAADCDDNCREQANPDQSDLDGDGQGDVCDGDLDGDGVPNASDNCLFLANGSQSDLDGDGVGDACAATDLDGDEVPDQADNCAAVANHDQADTDQNGQGDACDPSLVPGNIVARSLGWSCNATPGGAGSLAVALLVGLAWRRRRRQTHYR